MVFLVTCAQLVDLDRFSAGMRDAQLVGGSLDSQSERPSGGGHWTDLAVSSVEDWIFRLAKIQIEKHVSSTNGLSPSWHGSGNGGYLFKGQTELDGGGEAELLLSSTLDFYQRNTTIHIYQKINEHSYASYSDTWRNPPNYY